MWSESIRVLDPYEATIAWVKREKASRVKWWYRLFK